MRNARLDEAQTGIKVAGRNINNLRHADATTLMAEREELKASWWKWERKWKNWLKTQHSEAKIMTYGPITSWQINGETMETVTDFLGSRGSKITADGDCCSHEIKRCLLLRRKAMTHLDSILKSRDITLPTNLHLVKATFFPEVIYGCESWTIKLSTEELMLLNCGVGEDSWEFLGLQGDPTSPS